MSEEAQAYSITVSRDELEEATPVLQRICILQNQGFETAVDSALGLGRSEKLSLAASLVGAFASAVLAFAAAADAEMLWCGVMIVVAMFFCGVCIAHRTLGLARIKAAILSRFTNPLIRRRVGRLIAQSVKHAPFSVDYRFSDSSNTASVPKLKLERKILSDEITVAYCEESVFCLFKNNRSYWKAIIYAPSDENREVVLAFLKRNRVEVREPRPDPPSPEPPIREPITGAFPPT